MQQRVGQFPDGLLKVPMATFIIAFWP